MKAAEAEQTAQHIRSIFHLAALLQLNSHKWPRPPEVSNDSTFDYIIVGGGTAGCVLASRLLEIRNITVLLIEAGGDPPMESLYPKYYPYLKQSVVDWNFTSTSEVALKNLKSGVAAIPQGKMLGGSSNLNYMIYRHSNALDYVTWATVANDTSWLYDEILPHFRKNEQLIDSKILASSSDADFYGTYGNIKLRKFYSNADHMYFQAFEQMGHKTVLDINAKHSLGFSYCLFSCGKKTRQDTASAFLRPVKNHPRLHIMIHSLVTKIILDAYNTAVGVNVQVGYSTVTVLARKEIILSAGVFKTPQLLMLSGIGPKEHLQNHNIKARVNLPVGQNLQVSPVVMSVYKMSDRNPESKSSNPNKIDYSVIDGYVAIHRHDFPDYLVRSLIIDDPATFLEFCAVTYSFVNEVCDALYKYLTGKQIFITLNHLSYPKSRGQVLLRSSHPNDLPIVQLGLYSNEEDRKNHAMFLLNFHEIVNTTSFRRATSKFIDAGLHHCGSYNKDTLKFWMCYASAVATASHNYASTCAIGKVVDPNLLVKGVKKLRVVDASVIPVILSGPIAATVIMIAEKAAELIKEQHR